MYPTNGSYPCHEDISRYSGLAAILPELNKRFIELTITIEGKAATRAEQEPFSHELP